MNRMAEPSKALCSCTSRIPLLLFILSMFLELSFGFPIVIYSRMGPRLREGDEER